MAGSRFPAYPKKAHKSGQARIKIKGHTYYLGRLDSQASREEYARLATEFAAGRLAVPAPKGGRGATVREVVARWLAHVREEMKDRRERENYTSPLKVLVRLFGSARAADFGVEQLETVQLAMASGSWMTDEDKTPKEGRPAPVVGWCRNVVNRHVVRIRSMWKWAERKGLVPKGSFAHLKTLDGLAKNSGRVRHTADRAPATWADIERIADHVTPAVLAMLHLQWHAGMRTTEVVKMRVGDVATDGPDGVWLYALDGHKNAWREGETQVELVVLGEDSQAVLRPWLEAAALRGPEAFVFRPARRSTSKSYTRYSYAQAVRRACDELGLARWSPYCLRHGAKQRVTRTLGLDHARALLRQRSLGTTNGYAKQFDLKLATEAVKKQA